MIFRNLIFASILVTYLAWSNAQEAVQVPEFDFGNSTHWINCTINGTIYYDDDCANWLKPFFTWLGFLGLLILFLACGCLWYCIAFLCRLVCCIEDREPYQRVFINTHPNYSTLP